MDGTSPAVVATGSADHTLTGRLRAAADSVAAPDVVLAHSRYGNRTIVTGGTGTPPETPREDLRYEIGSATKTFTMLLLAHLADQRRLRLTDPADAWLPSPADGTPHVRPHPPNPVTLLHLATHTAGLPRLPRDFYRQALPRWRSNPYAAYPPARLLAAYARTRPRPAPGRRWRYSNFGAALLGPVLDAATGLPYAQLLPRTLLGPLGLRSAGVVPLGPDTDAVGHARDGVTALPAFDTGEGFQPAGAVRATPGDLLNYLEAHLRPPGGELRTALLAVQQPLLIRGLRDRHTHTLAWTRHPTPHGPLYFHTGATMGQEAFLAFQPDTGRALAALATRRYGPRTTLTHAAYGLLAGDP